MSRFVFQPFQSRHSGTIGELMQAGARARADALRKVGAIEAARAQQQGAIGAQAAQTIGGIVSGGVQQYLQAQQDAPRREAEALQVQALKDEASQRTAALQGQKVIDTLLKGALTTDPETGATTYDRSKLQQGITEAGVGHLWGQVAPLLDKSDASVKAIREAQHAALVDVARIVDATGNDATVFAGELSRGMRNGIFSEAAAAPYIEAVKRDPSAVAKITGALMGQKPTFEKVSPGESLVDPRNPKAGAVYTAPPKVEPPKAVYRVGANKRTLEEVGQIPGNAQLVQEPQPPRVTVNTGGIGASDPKAIAEAIISGDQPPSLQGLYRYGAPVRAELARRGYDLSTAMTDWGAVQKRISTLNGPQQTRLRQAAETAYHSLDVIEDLSKQWKGGRFPMLNKAQLVAAKQGALGEKAQGIATQLEAQISDLTSELGNVYMGGNSPTDHSLGLAAKNLSADWSQAQLQSAINLARKNLQIRLNSIRSTAVIGASENNPYLPSGKPGQTSGSKSDPLGIR